MSEKLTEVYEQYDMEIVHTRKGRGATILTTTDGLRILEPFRGNVVRLEQEYVLKKLFAKEGCLNIDMIIPNRDGELFTCDRYRQPFVLKKHFEGDECDMHNPIDVVRAIEALASLHIYGKKVALLFQDEWEENQKKKDERRMEEIKCALADGEELERIAHMYELSQSMLEELLMEEKRKEAEELQDEKNNKINVHINEKTDESGNGNCGAEDFIAQTFCRHNKELRKIHKFVSKVKRRNSFEDLFLCVFSDFYKQGVKCEEMLSEVLGVNDGEMAIDTFSNHYGICHGSYNHHNIIMNEESVAVVHFEKFSKGNQLLDLYQFARKAMEKNAFDYEMLDIILKTYAKQIELSRQDYRYIYVLFSYPEKFWKIANSYYNTNKAFLSPKYLEKLKTVLQQEKEKNEMLSQYFSFHLQ